MYWLKKKEFHKLKIEEDKWANNHSQQAPKMNSKIVEQRTWSKINLKWSKSQLLPFEAPETSEEDLTTYDPQIFMPQ